VRSITQREAAELRAYSIEAAKKSGSRVTVKETIVSQLLALLIAVTVGLVLSTSISIVMMKSLRGLLNQLCPGSDATRFWISFTTVMLYVTPLLFTLLFLGTVIVADLVNIVRTALFPSVLGVEFAALDSCLRWVHSGDSRQLRLLPWSAKALLKPPVPAAAWP
jgi:hypothetical protein